MGQTFNTNLKLTFTDKFSAKFKRVTAAIDKLDKKLKVANKSLTATAAKLNKITQNAGKTNTKLRGTNTTLNATSTKLNKITRSAGKLNNKLNGVNSSLRKTSSSLGTAAQKSASASRKVGNLNNKLKGVNSTLLVTSGRLGGVGSRLDSMGNKMSSFGGRMTLGVTAPILGMGAFALKSAASFESMRLAFQTLAGDVDTGSKLFTDLISFSEVTPFTPEQVSQSAQALLAYGVKAEDVLSTLKDVGDVVSGTGKSLTGLSIVFGQIKGRTKLTGDNLKQLAEAGFNPLQIILDKTGGKMSDLIDDMEAGNVSFKAVARAFKIATSEGGRFNNLMEKQSKTLGGLWSTFVGRIQILLGDPDHGLGAQIRDAFDLKKLIPKLGEQVKKIFNRFKALSPETKKLAFKMALFAAVIGPIILGLGLLVTAVGFLISPLGLAVTVFAALAAFMGKGFIENEQFRESVINLAKAFKPLADTAGLAFDAIKGLFGFEEGANVFDVMAASVDKLASKIRFILRPLEIMNALTPEGELPSLKNLIIGGVLARGAPDILNEDPVSEGNSLFKGKGDGGTTNVRNEINIVGGKVESVNTFSNGKKIKPVNSGNMMPAGA